MVKRPEIMSGKIKKKSLPLENPQFAEFTEEIVSRSWGTMCESFVLVDLNTVSEVLESSDPTYFFENLEAFLCDADNLAEECNFEYLFVNQISISINIWVKHFWKKKKRFHSKQRGPVPPQMKMRLKFYFKMRDRTWSP